MGGYKNFLRRMNAGGSTMRNEQIENALHLVNDTFEDDPAYEPDGAAVWNTDRILHPRLYLNKYRSTSPAEASIQTRIYEPFYLGDVISWPNHGYWLCIFANNLHDIQWEGKLSYCNYMVKFRSLLNGNIMGYPVSIINSTQYGSGEKERHDNDIKMRIGTSQMIMYMSYDGHTALIDHGFRFLVDRNVQMPTAFRITQADMVSYSDGGDRGYIHFTIEEDQFNPKTDNKDLMIADYYPDVVAAGDELQESDKQDMWL